MELRQTIRTGIRNIRRAWWEPGLMLAISALLVAAAWLWIPAPLVENPVQTELLYIQVDSGTHGMVRWKPKTMVERQTARAIVDHMATLHKKNTLCPAHKALEGRPNMYIHFRTEDSYQVVALQVGGGQRRGSAIPGMAAAWPWRRRCSSPRTWRRTFWRRSMGRCPARACERRGPAREGWRMLVSIDGCWKDWYAKSVRETDG